MIERIKVLVKFLNENQGDLSQESYHAIESIIIDMKNELTAPKITNLYQLFENGKERFEKEVLFNHTIQHLSRGVSYLKIIDDLLKINKKNSDLLANYIERHTIDEIKGEDEE